MGFRLEIRFDYLCLFVPNGDETVVVQPDLRNGELISLGVGPHYPVFRWRREQEASTAPPQFQNIKKRPAQHRSPATNSPSLMASELDGEDIEIRIGNFELKGEAPRLDHLHSLTGLEEGGLSDEFNRLFAGYLKSPPKAPPLGDKAEEEIRLASRIRLKGGSFSVEYEGLSTHDFYLADEQGNKISKAKKIARQVLWQSDEIDEKDQVYFLFKSFQSDKFTDFVHLRPANLSQKVVAVGLRNCDEKSDYLLPGLPSYAAIHNYEPRVYQTLSAGYKGFASVTKLIHIPVPQSGNSVCGPAKSTGVMP